MESLLLKGGEKMGTEFVLDLATIGLITVAIINRLKAEIPPIKSYFYTLMAIAIGAGLYAISVYAPPVVFGFIFAGLIASGIFDIYAKRGIEK